MDTPVLPTKGLPDLGLLCSVVLYSCPVGYPWTVESDCEFGVGNGSKPGSIWAPNYVFRNGMIDTKASIVNILIYTRFFTRSFRLIFKHRYY